MQRECKVKLSIFIAFIYASHLRLGSNIHGSAIRFIADSYPQ